MKTTKELIISAIMITVIVLAFVYAPVSNTELSFKLTMLCQDNPDKDCKEIFAYCEESLRNGQECFIIN